VTLSRLLVEMDDYVPGKGRRRKCESFYDTLWAWPGLCTPSPSLSPGGQDVRWGHDAMSPAVKWYLAPPPLSPRRRCLTAADVIAAASPRVQSC